MARRRNKWVYAKEAIVIVVGASPVVYRRAKVFDRRRDEYREVDLHMAPPVQEENQGVSYFFKSGERVSSDHPAVKAKPYAFTEEADDVEPALA